MSETLTASPTPADVTGTRQFRSIAGRFATGVAVVTSRNGDGPVGMTVNSFTTVSLTPRLLLVCLTRDCRLLGAVRTTGCFAVTVLAADQQRYAAWFADPRRPTGDAEFADVPVQPDGGTGCPLLTGGVAYFGCGTDQVVEAGDHLVLIGEVRTSGLLRDEPPLLFVDGHYAEVGEAL